MVQTAKVKEITHTEMPQRETEPTVINQTSIGTEVEYGGLLGREVRHQIGVSEPQAATSPTEALETKLPTLGVVEFPRDEDAKRNQRARANALMDAECLGFLGLFGKRKILHVEELNEHIKQTKDWLKLSLLIRADYLETLDSTVRITPEGLAAWHQLGQFKRLRDHSAAATE